MNRRRNFGLIAHIDAGKTTVSERILVLTGRIHRAGEVHDGNTTLDSLPQERERGITINAASTSVSWTKQGDEYALNLIDTPGHADFTMEVERSVRVLDGAIVVLDAVAGVEPQTETVWAQADKQKVPRVIFVNKMDRLGANFAKCLLESQSRLHGAALAIQYPLEENGAWTGYVDLVRQEVWRYTDTGVIVVHEPLGPEASLARQELLESLAVYDEGLFDRVSQGQAISPSELGAVLRRATLAGLVVPVLLGAAMKDRGVKQLLDSVVDYLPSPLDRAPVAGTVDAGETVLVPPSVVGPACAYAFKLIRLNGSRLTFLRLYAGQIRAGDSLVNSRTGKSVRLGRLVRLHAEEPEEVEVALAGDLVAAVAMSGIAAGDTLASPELVVALDRLDVPEPVVWVAIEPAKGVDLDKLSKALGRLVEEDPSLRVRTDEETNQLIMGGMGELHLEVKTEQLRLDGLPVRMGQPMVAYRSTLNREVGGVEGKFIRRTGGRGAHGHIWIDARPLASGAGIVFVNATVGGVIPKEYISPIEAGLRDALANGLADGCPAVDLEIRLNGGSYHEVDSSEMAFREAARLAVKALAVSGAVQVLEPMMSLEISTPAEYLGVVLGDLGSREGQVVGQEADGVKVRVVASVPLRSLFGYATVLRSKTSGRAVFDARPLKYAPVAAAKMARSIGR